MMSMMFMMSMMVILKKKISPNLWLCFTKVKAFCGNYECCGCGLKIQSCPLGVMEVSLGANWNGFEIYKPTTMA